MRIIRTIAASAIQQPNRSEHGWYEAALEIEAGGKTGLALFFYEWDKRDVLAEQLLVDPAIETAAKAECPEEGPAVLNGIFGEDMTATGDQSELNKARETATATVYSYE